MRRGKQETYRAQVEESMLPGQPVSLLGSCRDEHSPGVGVNMLGQHLLGQESEGNHQSPEQQQRAGPQIHQSIGVPRAGEQEGPGSRRVPGAASPAASQCQHPEAQRPLCPAGPSSAQAHMGPSPQKHRNRPSRTEARSAERQDSGQAQGTFPQT